MIICVLRFILGLGGSLAIMFSFTAHTSFQVFQIFPVKYFFSFLPQYNFVNTSIYDIYDLLPSIMDLFIFLVFLYSK